MSAKTVLLTVLALGVSMATGAQTVDVTQRDIFTARRPARTFRDYINDPSAYREHGVAVRNGLVVIDGPGSIFGPYPNARLTYATLSPVALIPNPLKDAWVRLDSRTSDASFGLRMCFSWPGDNPRWRLIPTLSHNLDSQLHLGRGATVAHSGAAATLYAADAWGLGPKALAPLYTGMGVGPAAAVTRYGSGALATGSRVPLGDFAKYASNAVGVPWGAPGLAWEGSLLRLSRGGFGSSPYQPSADLRLPMPSLNTFSTSVGQSFALRPDLFQNAFYQMKGAGTDTYWKGFGGPTSQLMAKYASPPSLSLGSGAFGGTFGASPRWPTNVPYSGGTAKR